MTENEEMGPKEVKKLSEKKKKIVIFLFLKSFWLLIYFKFEYGLLNQ